MADRRVLVTGSSGVVGSAIAQALDAAGWTVLGLDIRPGKWTTYQGDLRDEALCARVIGGVEGVVHTAALHAPHVDRLPRGEFHGVNVEATKTLLRQASQNGVRRLVYTSSTSVYGHALVPRDRAIWVNEQLVPQPRDIYDETKLAAETLTREYNDPTMSTAVLRIARCFAEPRAVQAAHRLYRGVSLQDVAHAHRLALERHDVSAVLNIAGPCLFSPADTKRLWLDAPAVIADRAPRVVTLFQRQGWSLPARIDRVYDSSEATRRLGYTPADGPASVALH